MKRREVLRLISSSTVLAAGAVFAGCSTGGTTIGGTNGGSTNGGTNGSTNGGTTNNGGSNNGGGGSTGGPTTSDLPNDKSVDFNQSISSPVTMPLTLTATSSLEVRFLARFGAQAAIIRPDNLAAFQNNQAYSAPYIVPSGQLGYFFTSLGPGNYYIAARNNSSSTANHAHFEVDIRNGISGYSFSSNFISAVSGSFAAGSRIAYPFTVVSGNRYFLFGMDLDGLDSYILAGDQTNINNFVNNGTFLKYTPYDNMAENDEPYYELHLAPGSYALGLRNPRSDVNPYAFHGDVYRAG